MITYATTFVGNIRFITRNGCLYNLCERAVRAATDAAWADKMLASPPCRLVNGRDSHALAHEVLEQAEDALIDDLVVITG